jgi:hypothetical protein
MRCRLSWLPICAVGAVAVLGAACGSSSGPSGPSSGLTGSLVAAFAVSQTNPGTTVAFTVTLPGGVPPGSPLVLMFAFDGQAGVPDTLIVPAEYGQVQGTVAIPAGFPDGTLTLTATLPQQHLSATSTLRVLDTQTPVVQGAVTTTGLPFVVNMTEYLPMLITGTTDTISVYATDNGGVTWVGYAIGPPANIRDSVAADSTAALLTVPITIPSAWLGSTPSVTLFARNREGNLGQLQWGETAVAAHITRPVQTVALDTSVSRAVYDTKRHVVYLAVRDQSAIQVLSVASMTFGTPLPLPAPAVDLDLRPGGDSLVVALPETAALGVINLNAPVGPPSVVHLDSINDPTSDSEAVIRNVQGVRVASDGRILVSVANSYLTALVQLTPATMTDSVVAWQEVQNTLLRSGNGAKVMYFGTYGGLLYDARAPGYTTLPGNGNTYGGESSADSDLSYFGFGYQVYTATSTDLGEVDPSSGDYVPASVISASGTQFYAGIALPYYVRLQEPIQLNGAIGVVGVPLDVVDTPEPITQFVQLADTTSLLALGADKAMLFNLTQSSPGPLHAVPAPRGIARRTFPKRTPVSTSTALVVNLHLGRVSGAFTAFPTFPAASHH